MTPCSQLQLTQANHKITTLTLLPTSRERTFGKPDHQAPLPFYLPKRGKMEVGNGTWGEAGVLPWVLAAAGLLPPASPGTSVATAACAGQCFTRQQAARCPTLPANTPWGRQHRGHGGRASDEKVASFLPALSSTQSTQKWGKLLRGGRRESMPRREKKKVHKWCY